MKGTRSTEIRTAYGPTLVTGARVALVCALLVALVSTVGASYGATLAEMSSTEDETALEVVFVFDRSDSMDQERAELAPAMERIDRRLDEGDVDPRYALLTYGETPTVERELTADYDTVEQAMNYVPEGTVENASTALTAALDLDRRPDAKTVVVLVTDEDDDGTAEQRGAAVDALSGAHLVAVSPADAEASSCAVHSPPCDDRTDNELREVVDDAGGDWIDIDSEPEAAIEQIGDAVTAPLDVGDGDGGGDGGAGEDADIEQFELAVNRTSVTVGDPVGVTVTVTNGGDDEGEYRGTLATERRSLASEQVTVWPGRGTDVTFSHAFDEPGEYELFVNHEHVGTVTVERPPTEVRTTGNNGTVQTTVAHARANETVRASLANATLGNEETMTLDGLLVTPAESGDTGVELRAEDDRQNGTPPLPAHVRRVAALNVNSTLGENATLAVEYTVRTPTATLYGYDPTGGEWRPLDGEAIGSQTSGNATEKRATIPTEMTGLAVGVREPAFEVRTATVEERAVEVEAPVAATMTIENTGTANGTYTATLSADGAPVASRNVSIPVGETRTVTLNYTPAEAGEHAVEVGNSTVETVTAENPVTTTTTATTTMATSTTDTTTATTTTQPTSTTAATTTTTTTTTTAVTSTATQTTATTNTTMTTTERATTTERGDLRSRILGISVALLLGLAAVAAIRR
jgi:hypothetical protein